MEILETKAYSLPEMNMAQNSTLMFKDEDARDAYFDSEGVVLANNVVKDVWRLYVDYLMHEGTPYPKGGVYNYFRFKLKNDIDLFFYVYDYEVKGSGQILYKLKLDTLQTYFFHNNGFMPVGEQLVLREHKDRFNSNKQPIIDKVIESVDIKPTLCELQATKESTPVKLALMRVGGDSKNNTVLSKAMYFWKIHEVFENTTIEKATSGFELAHGWGVSILESGNDPTKHIQIAYVTDNLGIAVIFIPTKTNLGFTFGKNNLNQNVLRIDFGNYQTWEGLYSAYHEDNESIVNISTVDPKQLVLTGNGRVFIHYANLNYDVYYNLGIESFSNDFNLFMSRRTAGVTDLKCFGKTGISTASLEIQQVLGIPDKDLLNGKVWGTDRSNKSVGCWLQLGSDINQKVYNFETEIAALEPNYTTTFYPAMTRIKHNDPKLSHSQFNPHFFAYQNEYIVFKRENAKNNNDIRLHLALSKENFSKGLLKLNNAADNMDYSEMYELEKVINLNNQYLVVKSSLNEYIDLYRTGEERLNEMQINKAQRDLIYKGVGSVLNVGAGAIGGAMGGAMVGGPVGAVAGAVTGGGGALIKSALNIAQGIQNLNQTKEEMKIKYDNQIKYLGQSLINVTGLSPDLGDLQNLNKIKLFDFKVRPEEKDYLDLYFHHFGYQTLEFKSLNETNLRSRKYFNFIQAEIINYRVINRLVTAEIIEDIKSRFRAGVTLFHYNEWDSIKTDYAKSFENYERTFDY